MLNDALASSYAKVALENVVREYPHKLDHLVEDAPGALTPRVLHPAFYGSYDWHSSVHMHWLLVRLLRFYPGIPEAANIVTVLDAHLSLDNIQAEIAYLQPPARHSFERTYGWAWVLKLQAEMVELAKSDARAVTWRDAVQPLAELLSVRYQQYLPVAPYPIRSGTHANSAFGLLFALDYAEAVQHLALRKLIAEKAHSWFGRDRRYPASYEPSGEDFLSPGLLEAALMLRLVDACSFADWWELFCPSAHELRVWLTPVEVPDRHDARLAHLDGLNLSRAWCWKMLKPQLPQELIAVVDSAIDAHLAASLPQASTGDYVGTHWLASFALLALHKG